MTSEQNLINTEKSISVYYNRDVDIDGFYVRDEVVEVINKLKRKEKYNNLLEPFSGHGAIGFNLLENNIAEKLCLLDIYQSAIDFCNITIEKNNLKNVCTTICADTVDVEFENKFDLVFGNPPWRKNITVDVDTVNHAEHQLRKKVDDNWKIHENFFSHIVKKTTSDVDIFLYEDSRFSSPETFEKYYNKSMLKVENVIYNFGINKTGYILHLVKLQ